MSLPTSKILFACKMAVRSLFQHVSAAECGFPVLKYCRRGLLIVCIDSRSICLPAEPGAARRAGASCGSALAYCCQASRTQPGAKRSGIPARSPLCTVGGRRGSRQGKSCGTPTPEHERGTARPPHSPAGPTAPQGHIQLPGSRPTEQQIDEEGEVHACAPSR